jgi:uncharacterized protein (TIGR01777 family)
VEACGVRRAIVRSGLVMTRQGGVFPLMRIPFALYAGGWLGHGRQWFPWVHVADAVGAMRTLIEDHRAAGPYNLVAPEQVTHVQFMRALGRAMRRPSLIRVPAPLVRLVLGDLSSLLLTGQRAQPQRLLDLGYAYRFGAVEAALSELVS